MEELIVYLLPFFALVGTGLAVWGIRLFRQRPGLMEGLTLALIISALLDNLILSLGLLSKESPVLENLNRFRYLMNALITPLLIWLAFKIIQKCRAHWATHHRFELLAGGSSLLMLLVWVVISFMIVFKPVELGGMLRYNQDTTRTPVAIVALDLIFLMLVMVWVLAAGIYVWRSYRSPWLLTGALLLFLSGLFSSLSIFIVLSNAAEIALQFSLLRTLPLLSKSPSRSKPLPG